MHLDKKTIEEEGEEVKEIAKPWIEIPINWIKVKVHTNKFIAIFSDNDLYVPVTNKELFEKKLGAKIIIENNKGHFDDEAGITKLPSALNAVLELAKI